MKKYNVICWQESSVGRKEWAHKKKNLTLFGALLYIARNIGKYPMIWVER